MFEDPDNILNVFKCHSNITLPLYVIRIHNIKVLSLEKPCHGVLTQLLHLHHPSILIRQG